jgi:site-specific DNA-methyltransferase (adenine-specific)
MGEHEHERDDTRDGKRGDGPGQTEGAAGEEEGAQERGQERGQAGGQAQAGEGKDEGGPQREKERGEETGRESGSPGRQAGERDAPDDEGGGGVPRDERPHPAKDVEEAGRGSEEEGDEPQPIRSAIDPGSDLAAFANSLSQIAEVLSGERRWCVVVSDCVRVLAAMPDRAVDHIITDPPYSETVHKRSIRRSYLPDTKAQPCRKTRKHDFGFEHLGPELQLTCKREFERLARQWRLVFADMELAGSWRTHDYIRTLVWVKDRAMPQISGDRPGSRVELIVASHTKGRKKWNAGGDGNVYQCPVVVNCNGHRDDRVHTAQKPDALMCDLICDFTDPDEIVFDPFAGSGTTGVAALRLGRRAILIERNREFAAIAHDRMVAGACGSTLGALRSGQRPLFAGT